MPEQVALAQLLVPKTSVVPNPDTCRLDREVENVGVANVTLTADNPAEIEKQASRLSVQVTCLPAFVPQFSARGPSEPSPILGRKLSPASAVLQPEGEKPM